MIALSIGSNLGNRSNNLFKAIELIKKNNILTDVVESEVYETDALLPDNAPDSWDIPFLNMAIAGRTLLSPHDLLLSVKEIERDVGRKEKYEHWSPREIDIDILAYNSIVLCEKDLTIPHACFLDREFFLLPMADILPDWRYPVKGEYRGKTVRELLCNQG